MKSYSVKELSEILTKHKLWLEDSPSGERADLSDADLCGKCLWRANLRNAYIGNACLRNADLKGADLRDADLRDADLSGANLNGADLSGVDLSCADLSGANLNGADLSDANLSYTDLSGADLSGADLDEADLRDTIIREIIGKTICSVEGLQGECGRKIILLVEGHESDWVIQCGCFRGTLDELKDWLKSHNRRGYHLESTMLSIEYLFSIARLHNDFQNGKS